MVKSPEDTFQVDQEVVLGVEAAKVHFFGADELRTQDNDPRIANYLETLRGKSHG
ncbi:hypothetical protein D3C76_1800130 [compost metagenome]